MNKRSIENLEGLDRQTPEYLVEFFKVRLPFYTSVRYEPSRGFWDIYRPLPEEIERLMMWGAVDG